MTKARAHLGHTLEDVSSQNDLGIVRAAHEWVAAGAGRWLLHLPSSSKTLYIPEAVRWTHARSTRYTWRLHLMVHGI